MNKPDFTKDDSRAFTITLVINIALLTFSLLYTLDMNRSFRPSFIEVEFGEFQSGTLAEFSEVQNEEVATRPNPTEVEAEEPQEEAPQPEEIVEQTNEEDTKPVDLPDQTEEIQEEKVSTPDTDKVDPTKQEAEEQEQVEIPPKTQLDEDVTEGAEESGDEDGAKGELNADQGTGNDDEKTAPYQLEWEGDIDRAPMVQPLPENTANMEGVITVRFQVRPDGNVGQIIPLRKMNPELEKEVITTLRNWRFSRLPSGVPQQAQWGTITFRFVFN